MIGRRTVGYSILILLSLLLLNFGVKWIHEWRLETWRRRVAAAGLYADMYVWHRFEWPNGEPLLENLLRRQEAFIEVGTDEDAEKLLTLGSPPVDVRIDCDPAKVSERYRGELRRRLHATVFEIPSL